MNITAYNHKLNQGVVKAMKGLTFDDCFLIERLNHNGTMGPSENCHRNVNNMIAEHGGTIVSGWRLYRDKELFENSIYYWDYHSVWKTTDGKYYDVTESDTYRNSKCITFWFDKIRSVDLHNGSAFNSIVIAGDTHAATILSLSTMSHIDVSVPYWTISDLSRVKSLDKHNGKYRYLNSDYPKNIELLEQEYGYQKNGNHIVPTSKNSKFTDDLLFDFAVNR